MVVFYKIWDSLKPNALLIAVFAFLIGLRLLNAVDDEVIPNEAFWLALGGLLQSFYQMMANLTTPSPAPTVPAEFAEKLIERRDKSG